MEQVVDYLKSIQSQSEAAVDAATHVLDKSLLSSHVEAQNSMVSSVGRSIHLLAQDEESVSTREELWRMAVSEAHQDPEDFVIAATDARLHRNGQVRAEASFDAMTKLSHTLVVGPRPGL